jgi:hypothetical protein
MNELPWLVEQVYVFDGKVESIIAAFQHEPIARRFVTQYTAITGCTLRVRKDDL